MQSLGHTYTTCFCHCKTLCRAWHAVFAELSSVWQAQELSSKAESVTPLQQQPAAVTEIEAADGSGQAMPAASTLAAQGSQTNVLQQTPTAPQHNDGAQAAGLRHRAWTASQTAVQETASVSHARCEADSLHKHL